MASLRARRRAERALGGYPLSGVGANETTGISIYDWAKMFAPGAQVTFGGDTYQAYTMGQGADSTYYSSNPPVFALEAIRILLFSEARFQWQQMRGGRPGDLFGNADLALLEEPWAGHTTRDLLAQAELDILAAGNSYWVRNGQYLQRLDPANVKIMTSRAGAEMTGFQIGDTLVGYAYVQNPKTITVYEPSEVCHYKPYPSAKNRFLGQSWLTACLPDVKTDDTVTAHKTSTIANGAKLAYVVSFDPTIKKDEFDFFVDKFHRQHEGPENAGKTLFLGAGADVKTVGQNFESLQLQATQGASEVRIAACAGVPPAIVGFSEGLKGSTLNAGNYGEARRRLADGTFRPLWGIFASAMQSLLAVPNGARLWYDDRDVAFLREDLADQANIMDTNTGAVLKLVQAGWEPDAAVEAVLTGDLSRLTGKHSGLYSVQLQPPLNGEMPPGFGAQDQQQQLPAPAQQQLPAPAQNGSGNGKTPALTP